MAKLMRKLIIIFVILCAMGGLILYRADLLHWGATLINRDNSLPDPIMLFSVSFVLGGLLLGIVVSYFRGRRASFSKVGRATSRVLCAIAGVSLVISILWDISFLRFVHRTLLTDFPERLQQEPPSYVWVPLAGILLFGLSFLLASIAKVGSALSRYHKDL